MENQIHPEFLDGVACACHEMNRRYCTLIGDDSQVCWSDAPEWQKDSARAGGRARDLGEPSDGPDESHAGWLAQKKADGWTYGPVKDPGTKTHPCMMPFHELPQRERTKDYLFGIVARAFLGTEFADSPVAGDFVRHVVEIDKGLLKVASPDVVADQALFDMRPGLVSLLEDAAAAARAGETLE